MKKKTWIIVVIVCLVLLLPILIDYFGNAKIKEIEYDKYLEIVENGENALLYVGDLKNSSYKNETVKLLKKVDKSGTKTDYASDYTIYSIDSSDLTADESRNIGTKEGYVFLVSGEQQKIMDTNSSEDALTNLVDAYYNASFNDNNKFYKVAKDAATYKKLVNSKDVTVAVFGRDTCYYCNIFKPVYNAVAEKYDVDIYFFDSDSYDKKEYQKIMDLGLTIPASCNSNGAESKLSDGFGTPLTIITQNGKTIDCISGYVDRSTLKSKLSEHGLIK